jgi:ABC-type polysaccharide/polyol phosphate transport system ATPase subunit
VGAEAAIAIEAVSKRFRLYHERPSSLKERILRFRRPRAEEFWALRDVGFDVPHGKTWGLVGPNGSGKTTLLKLIGGILRPTEGRLTTRGRIAALLELGAGFHPELTGRENVYLNASILGLSKQETDRYFDDIVGFAEIEDFIDNQVKYYSSGMFVRLGFAVAVHVDPEILLVDEVLAVGDEGFQKKCLDRVGAMQKEGRTIVFVTHAMAFVQQICDHATLLDGGRMRASGDTEHVIREFRAVMARRRTGVADEAATHEVEIADVNLLDAKGAPNTMVAPGQSLTVQIELRANRPVESPVVTVGIHNARDEWVFTSDTERLGVDLGRVDGKLRVMFDLKAIPLLEGQYFITIGVRDGASEVVYDWHNRRYPFDVVRNVKGGLAIPVEVRTERL